MKDRQFRDQFLRQEAKALRLAMDAAKKEASYTLRSYRKLGLDPDDFVAESVMKLYQKMSEGEAILNWKAYLKTIVRNKILKAVAKLQRVSEVQLDAVGEPAAPEDTTLAYLREIYDRFEAACTTLLQRGKKECVELIRLQIQKRQSSKELAALYGMTEGSIRGKIHRCMELFRGVVA